MAASVNIFKALHAGPSLFVLPNAWDARSAQILEQKNFPAVATSSAAVATSLGYADGENMPFKDYLFVVRRMLASVNIPLSVDIEMGYGDTDDAVAGNVESLVGLGVAGINIEDSRIVNGARVLGDAKAFARRVAYIKERLQLHKRDLFINVRCDAYLIDVAGKRRETSQRLKLYEDNGADGIFLPCVSAAEDIAHAANSTRLPLNVMCVPGLPDFETLQQLGVRRASMGPFLFNKVYDAAGSLATSVIAEQAFSPLLS